MNSSAKSPELRAHRTGEVRRILLPKLSEKGYEQRSERQFGRYTEEEMGLWVVCRATLQAHPTLFGQFL